MTQDLNLLAALDALLSEASVTGAARREHLSVPAMSRTLGRIRRAVGDPVLVRSGRAMVLTPRAEAMRADVRSALERARAVLAPAEALDLTSLSRQFTIRSNEAFAALLGPTIAERVRAAAPHVRLSFIAEGTESDADALTSGAADLILAALRPSEPPEIERVAALTIKFVGVIRADHPLDGRRMTLNRYTAASHIAVSRHGRFTGPIDDALSHVGRSRHVALAVPDYIAATFAVCSSDLLSAAPSIVARAQTLGLPIRTFTLPVATPPVTLHLAWHRRTTAEPADGWFRRTVLDVITEAGLQPATT